MHGWASSWPARHWHAAWEGQRRAQTSTRLGTCANSHGLVLIVVATWAGVIKVRPTAVDASNQQPNSKGALPGALCADLHSVRTGRPRAGVSVIAGEGRPHRTAVPTADQAANTGSRWRSAPLMHEPACPRPHLVPVCYLAYQAPNRHRRLVHKSGGRGTKGSGARLAGAISAHARKLSLFFHPHMHCTRREQNSGARPAHTTAYVLLRCTGCRRRTGG